MIKNLRMPYDDEGLPERLICDFSVGYIACKAGNIVGALLLLLLGFRPQVEAAASFSNHAAKDWTAPDALTTLLFVAIPPALETALLIVVIALLVNVLSKWQLIIFSGVFWGLVHSYFNTPFYGFMVAVGFMGFTWQVLRWKDRSMLVAYLLPFATHFAANAMIYYLNV
jgi:membrane protease YdiL (CAAX protease family)